MSSKDRARSFLGPMPRRTGWLAGGTLASVALVLTGIAAPATATPLGKGTVASPGVGAPCKSSNNGPNKTAKPSGGDKCQVGPVGPRGPQGRPGPTGPTGSTGPTGAAACVEIDSYAPSDTESFHAALVGGLAYAGVATTLGGTPVWQNISDADDNPGFPVGRACGISIFAQGDDAFIKVLTTDGGVYQTHGDVNGANFVWDEAWFPQAPGPNPMVGMRSKGIEQKGSLAHSGSPNRTR
ncbi:hypothetical protein AB0D54_16125 [Streptomyces xanthophaeus]|uniref:hypothetical protein n=1 Tax=Streptomyces xanthophaeus TaxID=67385 RepID=UPI0034446D4F